MTEVVASGWGEPCSLEVGDQSFEVLAVTADEAVSALYCFEVTCRCPDEPPDLARLVGERARLALRDGFGATRPVAALVAGAAITATESDTAELRLELRPEAYRLTLGRDSRVYQDATVVDIVRDVLARGGVDARWELGESYDERVYTAQYRESDWDFVARLLEEEGIHYWFDHEEAESILVLADRSPAAPELYGGAALPFAFESGARQRNAEHARRFGDAVEVAPTRFALRSFDPERPALQVDGTTGEGLREWYEAPGAGPGTPAAAQRRVGLWQQAARARSDTRSGDAASVRLVPGRCLELGGHPLARLDGRYFVTRARLALEQRRRGTAGEGAEPLACSFECIPADQPFRPPRLTPRAQQAGLQLAQVVGPAGEEIHPDETGRVRIQQRWDRQGQWDERSGRWARVVQRGTADSLLLPRMGWNVATVSEEGSVDLPVVVSRIFDGEHPPPYALPDNNTRLTLRTATSPGDGSFNELHLEDRAGSQLLYMNASNDMQVLVQNAKTERVLNDVHRSVGVDHTTDVGQNAAENVVGNQDTSVGGSESLSVGAAFMKLIGADEYLSIGGLRQLWVGLTEETHVVSVRQLVVGGALIDISLGTIALTSPLTNVLVGGAMVKSTVKKMTETVGGMASFQTIGGSKFELAALSRTGSVSGAYTETVGGTMTAKTKIYSDTSDSALAYSAASLATEAPEIVVEGKSSIEVKCGGSSIVVRAGEVVITAPAFHQSGGNVKVTAGGEIKVN